MLKQEIAKQFGKYVVDGKERFQEKVINDYPIMTTDDGWIVCIPQQQIDKSFTCGFVGMSGTGKSLGLHRLTESLFWVGKNIVILNDSVEETFDWTLKQDNPIFINEIALLKQNPVPLPILYVFPNTSSLKINERKVANKNYMKITIPFPQVLNNINSFITGINPEFELGQSSMYLKNMFEELSACLTEEDVKETIESEINSIPSVDKKSFESMKYKILSAFDTLFSEKITDISSPDAPSTLSYGDFIGNPFSALMKAEVIPSFITSDLYNKKYKSEIFAYHIDTLFENQTLPEFKDTETYLIFDELTKVCSTEDKNVAEKSLGNVIARGRHFRLGFIFATQNYDKIPNIIRSARFDYLIAFHQKNHDVINTLIKDFDLQKSIGDEIKNLKPLECIAITNKKFICYKNDEVKEVNEPIKGRIIPPLSKHRKTG